MDESSVEVGVAEDAVEGLPAVFPADLLALSVISAVVADGHLVDPAPARGPAVERWEMEASDLRGDLGLEAEAVALERDALDHFAAKHLVAHFHVGKVQVGEHIGKQRE